MSSFRRYVYRVNNLFVDLYKLSKNDYSFEVTLEEVKTLLFILKKEAERSETIKRIEVSRCMSKDTDHCGQYNDILINIICKVEVIIGSFQENSKCVMDVASIFTSMTSKDIDNMLDIVLAHIDDLKLIDSFDEEF